MTLPPFLCSLRFYFSILNKAKSVPSFAIAQRPSKRKLFRGGVKLHLPAFVPFWSVIPERLIMREF